MLLNNTKLSYMLRETNFAANQRFKNL